MSEKAKDLYMNMVDAIKAVDTVAFHASCVEWCVSECTSEERQRIVEGKKELPSGAA